MTKDCPKCGAEMELMEADPGEAPTLACPMGGAPAVPAMWVCHECEHEEIDTSGVEGDL